MLITVFGSVFPEEIVLDLLCEKEEQRISQEPGKDIPASYLAYSDNEPIGVLPYGPSRYIEVDKKTIEPWRVKFLPGYLEKKMLNLQWN